LKKPSWLRLDRYEQEKIEKVKNLLRSLNLHTVCEESMCPNIGKCFAKKSATFLIMGDICTRNCRFCDIKHGKPKPVDPEEPDHIVEAVKVLKLKHVVITSVTRDDLKDGGASYFALITEKLKAYDPKLIIELLIPDLKGVKRNIEIVVNAKPHIINHNVEVVPRLYKSITPQSNYQRSLNVLKTVKELDPTIFTKSGLMVGLGEHKEEVIEVMKDLVHVNCDILTIGQYLKPPSSDLEIVEFIHPKVFEEYKQIAYSLGFKYVSSGPFVRSSYNAEEFSRKMHLI